MPVLDASRALEWGLLTEVVKASKLDAHVMELAQGIAAAPRSSVAGTKATFRLLEQQMGIDTIPAEADELRAHTSATLERQDALSKAKSRLRKP
jgi:enoyl-CoA hydratase/carnithine racemase